MTRRARRFVAAALLAALAPLAAMASMCAAHCGADASIASVAPSGDATSGNDAPCPAQALCLLAQPVPVSSETVIAFPALDPVQAHAAAAVAVTAEPAPPPVPPRVAA